MFGIDDGEYILVRGVDFGDKGAASLTVSCSALLYGGRIEVRLDDVDGWKAGIIDIPNTKFKYQEFKTGLTRCTGVHDLYFVFKGSDKQRRNLFNFDWWKAERN